MKRLFFALMMLCAGMMALAQTIIQLIKSEEVARAEAMKCGEKGSRRKSPMFGIL